MSALADHENAGSGGRAAATGVPATPKMEVVKLTPEEREFCDLERKVQLMGPFMMDSYGPNAIGGTPESWKKKTAALKAAISVLEKADPKEVEWLRNIRMGYDDVAVNGPTADGAIQIGKDADPAKIQQELRKALDRATFEKQRTELYGLLNEIAAKTGVEIQTNYGGSMTWAIEGLKQLKPYLESLPPDTALAKVSLAYDPKTFKSMSFSGNELRVHFPGDTGPLPKDEMEKLMASVPKSEFRMLADRLAAIAKEATVKENQTKLQGLSDDFAKNDPAMLRTKLKEQVAKTPLTPPGVTPEELAMQKKLRDASKKWGPDVSIRTFDKSSKDVDRILGILDDLVSKGWKMRQPSRTFLIASGSSYGIKKEEPGRFYPMLGGDCLPWAVVDQHATREQIMAMLQPPDGAATTTPPPTGQPPPPTATQSQEQKVVQGWASKGGRTRDGEMYIRINENHPPLTPGMTYIIYGRGFQPTRWKYTTAGWVRP